MQTVGSVASVVAAIREDVAAEVERISQSTASELESIRREAAVREVSIPDRTAKLSAAHRATDEAVAHAEWEGRRAAIEQRERWVVRVVEHARCDWSAGDVKKRRKTLLALATEAVSSLPAASVELIVAGHDRQLLDESWRKETEATFGKEIAISTGELTGGCIARGGNLAFDNTFEARALRLEPEWRSALAEVYRP